jgi:hypothetical protein
LLAFILVYPKNICFLADLQKQRKQKSRGFTTNKSLGRKYLLRYTPL